MKARFISSAIAAALCACTAVPLSAAIRERNLSAVEVTLETHQPLAEALGLIKEQLSPTTATISRIMASTTGWCASSSAIR